MRHCGAGSSTARPAITLSGCTARSARASRITPARTASPTATRPPKRSATGSGITCARTCRPRPADRTPGRAIEAGVDPLVIGQRIESLKAERDETAAAIERLADTHNDEITVDDACEILDSLPDLTEALAAAEPEIRRRVFDAFRLSVSLDRNAGQIHVKALVSSAFTKARDLQSLVANGFIAGAGFEPATFGL